MKHVFFLLIQLLGAYYSIAQDSLWITGHYSVRDEIECCKTAKNQLKCIDSLIELNGQKSPSGKNAEAQLFKQQRAFVIYHINAGGIYQRRGNYSEAKIEFSIAETYADSLRKWTKNNQDIEQILSTLQYEKKQWCFDLYRSDLVAFYAYDCAKFFPELNEKDSIAEEIEPADTIQLNPTLVRAKLVNHYGNFYLNDTLRIAHQFVCDSASANYFKKYQSHMLTNLASYPFSEIMLDMSANINNADTLVIKVELIREKNQITKKCSTVYSSCPEYLSDWYLYFFSNLDFNYPRESFTFYVPIVVKAIEPDVYFNLNRVTLADDHYLIEIEKIVPLNPK